VVLCVAGLLWTRRGKVRPIYKGSKRIILVGKSGSGKDTLRNTICELSGARPDVACTTRPPRDDEHDGQDYYFLNNTEFTAKMKKGDFYYYQEFPNGWKYGCLKQSWSTNHVFIMTPLAVANIFHDDRKRCLIVLIRAQDRVRMARSIARRGDADSAKRRCEADRVDFEGFDDYDFVFENNSTHLSHMDHLARLVLNRAV